MNWKDVIKDKEGEEDMTSKWMSDDAQAKGKAHITRYNDKPMWMIDEFGIENTGKGEGQKYLEDFLEHLESIFETGDMALVGTMASKAVSFWERMEAEGLVIV